MALFPEGTNGAVQDLANKGIQKAVNYGSDYLNSKLNYGLNYAASFLRQYDVLGILPEEWSIIDESGEKAFSFDSFQSADVKQESKVTHSPVEGGSFATYNIVQTPTELSCMIAKHGFVPDLIRFVDALQTYLQSTDLLTVVTPEKEYENMKLTKFNFNRSADNGTDIIYAELSFIEVREVTSQFTNVRVAAKKQRGLQQGKETSAAQGIFNMITGR